MAPDPSNRNPPNPEKRVSVGTFGTREAAELAAAGLQAHSIECWTAADDGGGMYPNLTLAEGVRLLVRAADAEAASALLTSPAPEPPAQSEAAPDASVSSNAHVPLILALLLLALLGALALGTGQHESAARTAFHYVNGKADQEWIYRHGRLTEFLQDRNFDGTWDLWYYYDKNGQYTNVKCDNNFDRAVDESLFFSNDLLVRSEVDRDFNGTPDEFCSYKYGVIQQIDLRPNGAKLITQRWIFHHGVLAEILEGDEGDGKFQEAIQYDPFFNPVHTNLISFPLLAPSN